MKTTRYILCLAAAALLAGGCGKFVRDELITMQNEIDQLHKQVADMNEAMVSLRAIVNEMAARGFSAGKVHIDHCLNLPAATKLKDLIEETFPQCSAYVHPTTALCSYYADKGGLIIGYEV